MSLFHKDTRGKESRTLTMVSISWFLLSVKFLASGLDLGSLGTQPTMTAAEYGSAVALVLTIWLGREWTEKTQGGNQ